MIVKIRHRARWQIVALMKAHRVRQQDIAGMAGVSQSTVVRVISRQEVSEDKREAVWNALEDALKNALKEADDDGSL